MRGTRSKGKMRSVPAPSPYTLNVMPMLSSARSAERCRRSNSPIGQRIDELRERARRRARTVLVAEHLVEEPFRIVLSESHSEWAERRSGNC